jgi:hypothetical protein
MPLRLCGTTNGVTLSWVRYHVWAHFGRLSYSTSGVNHAEHSD